MIPILSVDYRKFKLDPKDVGVVAEAFSRATPVDDAYRNGKRWFRNDYRVSVTLEMIGEDQYIGNNPFPEEKKKEEG